MAIQKIHRHLLALSITAALAGMPFSPAIAQSAQAPDADENAENADDRDRPTTLSEIKVTAQKREELLQDVPITVTALSGQALRDVGVRDIKDLQILVSDLSVTSTGSDTQTTARIRGVGTVGDNPGLESSVGVVIDGVYRPRNGVAFGDLGEIQQIEVLKGPQGTVFGKNTSAGLINITTKRPSFNHEAYAELTAGNYGALGVNAVYNNAVGDAAAFRIYAVGRERDGFNKVETAAGPRTSREDGNQDFHSVRAQLLLTPSGDVDVNFIADYTRRDEECCVGVTLFRGPSAAIVNALSGGLGVIPVADPSRRLAYGNRETDQQVEEKGISAEVNWNTPWAGSPTFTSITALRRWDSTVAADLDFSGADIWYRSFGADNNGVRFRTFSQELRLAGGNDRIDWMGGLYFDDEDLERNDAITLGGAYEPYLSIALLSNIAASFPPGLVDTAGAATFLSQATGLPYGTALAGAASRDRWEQNAKSTSAFGNVTFHVTDALDLTAGARYTHGRKSVDSFYSTPNGANACGAGLANPGTVGAALAARGVPAQFLAGIVPTVIGYLCLPWSNTLFNGLSTRQDLTENEWSGTFRGAYRWNETLMTYASAARGYKAGGFNLDRAQSADGFSSGGAGIVPVEDTSFPGEFVDSFELGAKTTWQDGNLLLNAALFHSKYTDFQLNSFLGTSYVVRSVPKLTTRGLDADILWQTGLEGLSLQGGLTYTHARYGDDLLPDAALSRLPGSIGSFAPKWQATSAFAYQWLFGRDLKGRFSLGAKYTSDYNTGSDLNPLKQQESFTLVNAGLSIGSVSNNWSLRFWAHNLTNRTYTQVAFDAPIQTGSINGFLGAPRTYGLTAHLGF